MDREIAAFSSKSMRDDFIELNRAYDACESTLDSGVAEGQK